jgi:hypothetical protein
MILQPYMRICRAKNWFLGASIIVFPSLGIANIGSVPHLNPFEWQRQINMRDAPKLHYSV